MTNLPIGDSDVAALVAAAEECKFMELEQLEPSGFSYVGIHRFSRSLRL